MRTARGLFVLSAIAVLPAVQASAQTMPWPTDAPRTGAAQPAWPNPGGAAATPAAPTPMMMSPAPAAIPGFGTPPAQQSMPPCYVEFTKLREEVEKRGKAAKTASEHKATREEMCKHITAFTAAEGKWAKFIEENSAKCSMPPELASQIKTAHSRSEEMREKICSPMAAGPVAPSLSDALGTTRLPTPQTTKTGSGTLDTLTGNAIQTR
jgi:hypothetical protein